MHALHHVSLFSLVPKDPSGRLIFVHKCQLTSCLVQQHLVHHAIRAPRVFHSPIECHEPQCHHYWKHDRVRPVKWVLLDKYGKDK